MNGFFSALSGLAFEGYEIHMGQSVERSIDCPREGILYEAFRQSGSHPNVCGTYIHGIFDRGAVASALVGALAERKGLDLAGETGVRGGTCRDYREFKEEQYDRLADILSEYLNMEEIYGMLREAAL